MNQNQPLIIQINEVHRRRKTVAISYAKGSNQFSLEETDNPLPAFGQSFDALLILVPLILHLPETWAQTNCRVMGLKFDTLGGSPTVALLCKKGLDDASKEFAFTTPPRLLRHPVEEGSYHPPLTNAQAALVEEVVEQAKQYVMGNRAQGEIAFDSSPSEPAEPEEGEKLPLGEGTPATAAAPKKRGRKPKATAEAPIDV